ncbi:DnaJ C-terminal domain-containing protein [Massilia sp. Leaf139]|uniref:DnaJ C-terminal domain-containing protein n=1 Tax=Massilia sp. Leaf139 TaxID=1736272 RepID=UPI0006FADE01|nr:DnaJ C-terminal domain-containing protein [Massilia sp. Leaf139]KQQ86784.1 cytochrome C biogenesis protein [Massilia sp. Leaf139]
MENKDYYQTLGVDKGASADEIKKAYRKLVRKYHPDISGHADADAKTKELNEAYEVLGDADKRAAYDARGRGFGAAHGGYGTAPDWSNFEFGGAGADDFFADLFAKAGRPRRGFEMRGDDIHAAITIDLMDAYHGATRSISLRMPQGSGRGGVQDRTLSVTIPRGVTPGQQLRLAGQGHPGHGGAPAGDLYLEVQFAADPRYRVEGAHVTEHVPVTPWEAALGGSVSVPTPDGMVEITVPAGSQSGRKLRLKGKGIPAKTPGDLYVILDVVLPPANNDKARALYQAMARDLAFNPRAA